MISLKSLLFFYLLFIIAFIAMKYFGFIKSKVIVIFIMFILPAVGEAIFIANEIIIRKKLTGIYNSEVNILKNKDNSYRMVAHKKLKEDDITVPLEEALLINDTKTRRELMLGILRKNPDEYFSILKKAQVSNDVEIAHYATSTMMGIQSEYETKLRVLKDKYYMDSSNKSVAESYIYMLNKYIDSGLLQGKVLRNRREELDKVLNNTKFPNNSKQFIFMNINNKLELKSYDNIEKLLNEAKERWEDDENIYMMYTQYYRDCNLGYRIKEIMDEVKEKEVYLTHSGKEWYAFWNGGCVI